MKYLYIVSTLFFVLGCSTNYFDELAKKDTNQAKFFQAKMEMDGGNFSTAVSIMQSIDADYLAHPDRRAIHASAYSGNCGLDFLTLLNNLQNAGSATIIGTLLSGFPGANSNQVSSCITAEGIIEGFGSVDDRSGDENLLMMFNGFAKVGTMISSAADVALVDGIADAGFNVCTYSDDQIREIGSGIAHAIISLGGVGTGYVDDAAASITALCGLPGMNALCNKTDESLFTDAEIDAIRSAVGSSDYGIDSCAGAPGLNIAACALHVTANCAAPNP